MATKARLLTWVGLCRSGTKLPVKNVFKRTGVMNGYESMITFKWVGLRRSGTKRPVKDTFDERGQVSE